MIYYFSTLYGGGSSIEDIKQAGYEGLLKALAAYDPSYGTSFSTYAAHHIMGEIRHTVRKEMRFYYPNCLNPLKQKADQIVSNKINQGLEPPALQMIAKELNITAESLSQVMAAGMVKMDKLDLASIHSDKYESFSLPIEDKITLSQLFSHLDKTQAKVLNLTYFHGLTQKEIAEEMGISQRQVSRIKERGIKKMKNLVKINEIEDPI